MHRVLFITVTIRSTQRQTMTLTPQRPNVNPIIISFSQPHNICISPLRYAAIRVKRGQIKKEMGGKKNKNRRKEKEKHGQGSSSLSSFPSPPLSASAGPDQPHFPLPLHANADFPPYKDGFLRDVGNCRKSYQHALDTAYEGFVCDGPDATTPSGEAIFNHERIRRALQKLDSENYFRTDVTQPFGLGTKCAKTYVTRCLLGARGTTYKYLGLRMFSHPWDGSFVGKGQDGRDNKNEISIKNILKNQSNIILKIDIEGDEYKILEHVNKEFLKINLFIIEFHNIHKNLNKIKNFIKKTKFKIIHIHGNNYGGINKNNDPKVVEMTFINSNKYKTSKVKSNFNYPIIGLDYKNLKRRPDIKLKFHE